MINTQSDLCNVDPQRIYLTGHSNGCALAQRVAIESSDLVAAVACMGMYRLQFPMPASGACNFAAPSACHTSRATVPTQVWRTCDGWAVCVLRAHTAQVLRVLKVHSFSQCSVA